MTPHLTVVNVTRGRPLAERCELAKTFWTRLRGLMGRASLEPGTGLLIYPEWSVHTFFMRIPIDVVFVGSDDRVVGLEIAMPPNRPYAGTWGARYVIELPAQTVVETGTQMGDQLDVTPSPHN